MLVEAGALRSQIPLERKAPFWRATRDLPGSHSQTAHRGDATTGVCGDLRPVAVGYGHLAWSVVEHRRCGSLLTRLLSPGPSRVCTNVGSPTKSKFQSVRYITECQIHECIDLPGKVLAACKPQTNPDVHAENACDWPAYCIGRKLAPRKGQNEERSMK